ncbi:hypothetical protein ACQ5SP_13730 [Rhodovulum sp. YNF3179]|uniref:hypothetical protein n=1 Tax=Rhodovulum sp. YNF3179 TaxID=3425127 RepID=UPI003D3260F3
MQIKTLIVAAALTLSPAVAMAECSWGHKSNTASQCGEGQAWDSDKGACVDLTTS